MRALLIILLLVCSTAYGQLLNTVELSQKASGSESEVQAELLQTAVLKSLEKFAPELGFENKDLSEKLNQKFKAPELMKAHKFLSFSKDPKEENLWSAKVELELDKLKVEKLLQRVINHKTSPVSKLLIVSEITPLLFTWKELGLENDQGFLKPLNVSWHKWESEHLPLTVDEVVICDSACLSYYNTWTESQAGSLTVPEEYKHAVFLQISLNLRRTNVIASVHEVSFQWEGRAVLHDVGSKRILSQVTLPAESRSFRQPDQKVLNSSLASSLYRTPISALMEFNKKLEIVKPEARSSKLVIKGFKNIGDVLALTELLKTRGNSLGLEVSLASFNKDEANLVCFYQGEEKSFTDLLSAIKELKSSHRYVLVNESTGVHHIIKLVTE